MVFTLSVFAVHESILGPSVPFELTAKNQIRPVQSDRSLRRERVHLLVLSCGSSFCNCFQVILLPLKA